MKNKLIQNKFNTDLLWNLFAFGGIVVIGILLNILIITFYNEEALGVFNLTYAVYILLSQLAVGGVHLSIQYFVPKYAFSRQYVSTFLLTALISSVITGLLVVSVGYLLIPALGELLNSDNVAEALFFTLWGLFFFSFNKIILSVHNGLRNMRSFALFQFLRFLFMLIFLLVFIVFNVRMQLLSCLLAISELLLFFGLIFSVRSLLSAQINKRFKKIFYIQFRYGNKALTGNFLLDINTKVDVFTLGIFLNDYWVGIYSFAATVAEGFMQLPVVMRNNINPIITRLHSKADKKLTERVLATNRNAFYKVIIPLGLLSMIVFPLLPYLLGMEHVLTVTLIYLILCGSFMLSGGYQPFLMIFNQFGSPGMQTRYIMFIFATNVFANFLLVPFWGVYGAALGTACSFFVQVFALKYLMRKKAGIRI